MESRKERDLDRQSVLVTLLAAPIDGRAALIEEYRIRSEAAYAPSTRKNLDGIKRLFSDWCEKQGVSSALPVSPSLIARYVDHLGGKLRPNTIEVRLWGIAELHRAAFLPSPCHHRFVEFAVKAVKRQYGSSVRQAAPLGRGEVLAVIAALGNRRRDIRDAAALWIASDSWCRAGEMVALRVRDLLPQKDGSSLLFISRSKTDQHGHGDYAYLSVAGTVAVRRWIELDGLGLGDPILTKSQRNARRTPLDPTTVSRIFKKCTGRREVSAHSTRVGGVQDALTIGCDLSSIMVAGRWTSPEMPARYGRRLIISKSASARVCSAFDQPGSPDGNDKNSS